MPYNDPKELPEAVRGHLPEHAQKIFLEAYNHALQEYSDESKRRGKESQEEAAFKVAWAAVKNEYQKNDRTGMWEPKPNK